MPNLQHLLNLLLTAYEVWCNEETSDSKELEAIKNEFISAIKSLLIETIGENEPEYGGTHTDVCIVIGKNMMRAEIRKEIERIL